MIPDIIRKNAIWLFGVLVGLALKEALTSIVPHFLSPDDGVRGNHIAEFWRLFIFVVVAVRFFFGATVYFDDAYERCDYVPKDAPPNTPPVNPYKSKSFGADFLFGFFHFVLFAALSMTLENHTSHFGRHDLVRELSFLGLLCLILCYDLFWLLMNWKNSTYHLIKRWTVLNLITVSFVLFVFFLVWFVYYLQGVGFNLRLAEAIALIPVLLASGVDIIELIMGKPIVKDFFTKTGRRIASIGDSSPG